MKKKGFTLIELLAVIVILAIIALIAVPVIMDIISSAKKSAFEDTAYGLISAGEMYYAQALLNDGMTEDVTFTFSEEGVSPSGLSVKGNIPTEGSMKITTDGKVSLAISNGETCITKGYEDSKIDPEGDVENCVLPPEPGTLAYLARINDFATEVHACAAIGTTCAPGTEFAIEVAPGDIKNFYVVSDVNNKVTLIMDRNIGDDVAWNASGNITDGPITALNYLESQTSSWTNIPAKIYTLMDDGGSNSYTMERTNARTRMLTKTEANAIIGYGWVYGNLNFINPPHGYWTSSVSTTFANAAWYVFCTGNVNDDGTIGAGLGVRPVIELSK